MAIVAWRLGLGWLIGRRRILLTTAQRRVVLPYRLFAGTFYLLGTDEPWAMDLVKSPQAMVQAAPGPRAVRARPLDDPDELELARRLWSADAPIVALSPTGQRTPGITAPDLLWVWPVAAVAVLTLRRLLR
jgi:hypothetical protein